MKNWIIGGAIALIAVVAIITFLITKMMIQMDIDRAVEIYINEKTPIEAEIDSSILISILNDLQTQIQVNDDLKIRLNENFEVPLKMNLTVPLNTEIFMDQALDLEFELPVDIVLDQTEMPLQNLKIPFNQRLNIQDSLDVDFFIDMDTKIKTNFKNFVNVNLPVKARVPVKQKIPVNQPLQVNDTLILSMQDYQIPLRTTIPVKASVPVKQNVKIQGELSVPVDQVVTIPLSKVISTPVLEPFTANVKTTNNLETSFKSALKATAIFNGPMKVAQMDSLRIGWENVKIRFK